MSFKINPSKKISVLIPTRGRPTNVLESIQSLANTSDDPSGIEFLIAVDDDDQKTIDFVESDIVPYCEENDLDFYAYVQPRMGYSRLNEYLNQLAGASNGEWLLVWNDDAFMESQGWDTEVLSHSGQFAIQRLQDNHGHPYAIFPIIPRDWLMMFGTISPHSLTDAWVSQVAYMNDAIIQLKSKCLHDRADLTGNNDDETYAERQPEKLEGDPTNPKDFLYPATHEIRIAWGHKMEWFRKRLGQDNGFLEKVRNGDVAIWSRMNENDPKGFLHTYTLKKD